MSGCAGVTVVVDSQPGVREVCDPTGGGQAAATLFARNGWKLTQVSSSPGFVCRVDGQPANVSCGSTPPANAYWSLWISAGPGKPWTYATLGPYSLTVPKGGSVAFSWDARPGNIPPTVAPGDVSASPSAHATQTAAAPAQDSGSGNDGGVPGWVAPAVVAVVLIAALAVMMLRRRRG